jgi:hypothetical protein
MYYQQFLVETAISNSPVDHFFETFIEKMWNQQKAANGQNTADDQFL